jgi:N-acetylneuraminic acid mutarotase
MTKTLCRISLLLAAAALAEAHFIFVVPDSGASSAKVFLGEDLKPAGEVDLAIISGAKLSLLDAAGKEVPLQMVKGADAYSVPLSGSGTRVIHGVLDLGFTQSRGPKPYLLIYYPKSILGNAFDAKSILPERTPIQIVPVGKPGDLRLRLLVRGKAEPNAEITAILPDGTQKKLKTDSSGQTETLTETGRYGAWARYWEATAGERDNKKYEEIRHYATLVFDAPAGPTDAASSDRTATTGITARKFATLPEATSSFGSVVSDGWLYVYGGHIAPTHSYSTAAVSGQFHRLRLTGNPEWEELPSGPPMQGMNLVALDGKIYRVGGMSPRNSPGTPTDNYSTADAARFDPASGKWEALPSLPEPRSSHDVVVIGNKIIVTGGWAIRGKRTDWADTLAILDLSAEHPAWTSVPQPFRRRALMAAALDGKMYVIGGFDEKSEIVRDVAIYDPVANTWSHGPQIPEGPGLSFAPAAAVHHGDLYVSVSDGTLYRLNRSSMQWEKAGKSTPRLAHRIASDGDSVLVMGGAENGKNFDLIEAIPIP